MNKKKKARNTLIMYAVFAAVLAALVLYIVLRRSDRMQYALPEIPATAAKDIDTINVEGNNGAAFTLTRAGDSWQILPEGYRPDPGAVEDMLQALEDLKLTDLVSTSKSYERYELDDEGKIHVNAADGDQIVRDFNLGKRAPSNNHTYIMLASDTNIYQAAADLRRVFDKDVQDIRDKNVLTFVKEEVIKIGVTIGDRDFRLFKEAAKVGTSDSAGQAATWNSSEGGTWPAEKVDEFLGRLDDLTCTEYLLDKDADLGLALLVLDIQDQEDSSFSLYEKDETGYRARSSQTPYAFYISAWQGDTILKPFTEGESDAQ